MWGIVFRITMVRLIDQQFLLLTERKQKIRIGFPKTGKALLGHTKPEHAYTLHAHEWRH